MPSKSDLLPKNLVVVRCFRYAASAPSDNATNCSSINQPYHGSGGNLHEATTACWVAGRNGRTTPTTVSIAITEPTMARNGLPRDFQYDQRGFQKSLRSM